MLLDQIESQRPVKLLVTRQGSVRAGLSFPSAKWAWGRHTDYRALSVTRAQLASTLGSLASTQVPDMDSSQAGQG
jgi:hypothetical protein